MIGQYRLNYKKVFSDNPMIWVDPMKVRYSILCSGVMGRKGTTTRKKFYSTLLKHNKVLGGDWDRRVCSMGGPKLPDHMLGKDPEKYMPIIEDIRKNGYKTQKELGEHSLSDEVTIAIGRNGELFHADGIHRLLIAKKLGLKKIPVRVILKHVLYKGN